MFAAQNLGDFNRQSAQRFAFGVYEIPLTLYICLIGHKRRSHPVIPPCMKITE
jgi:hypothetical protein